MDFEFSNNFSPGQGGFNVRLTISSLEIFIRSREGQVHYLAQAFVQQPIIVLSPNTPVTVPAYLTISPFLLQGIERVRGDGDLFVQPYFRGYGEQHGQPSGGQPFEMAFQFEVAKSTWAERILLQLGYKDVSLIEIPRLPTSPSPFTEAVNHLNEAWRKHAMGEYRNVLGECRNALESISKNVRQQGYEGKDNESGENVPDWKKIFGDREGDIVGTIFKKLWGFTTPGSHTGKSIDRPDADFALMTTLAIVNLVSRTLTQS